MMETVIAIYKRKNETSTYRRAMLEGKQHIVLPVTMMVEGVHSGSMGSIYHSIAELGRIPQAWDGRPIVIRHPQVEGVYVSANSPDILDSTVHVGKVFNTHVVDSKLVAEAWLSEEKLQANAPDVLEAINHDVKVEVSVGVFTDNEPVENGNWNGETYTHIAHNHRPDHLALLPGERGACSVADGCGLGVNKNGGNMNALPKKEDYSFVNNSSLGASEILETMRRKVDAMDNEDSVHYLQEVYDDHVVYEKRNRSERVSKLYKQSYEVDANNNVSLIGNPFPVRKKVEYVNANLNNNQKEVPTMENEKKPCGQCMEKVIAIINANVGYTSAHREKLLAADEAVLDMILEQTKTVQVNAKTPATITSEQILAAMSAEDKEALAYGKKQLAEKRASLIQGIQANTSKELWPDAELNAMNETMLEKLFKSVKKEETPAPVDYSANSGFQPRMNANKSKVEPLGLTGFEFED